MRRMVRAGSRLAFVVGLGLVQLLACSSDRHDPAADVQSTGTLGLPLQATGQSGRVYRLRDAFFEIKDIRTGDVVEFLFSEDFPASSPEITTVLRAGNYTVELLDGWRIERVSDGQGKGGSGGGGGSGGTSTAGRGGVGAAGEIGDPGEGDAGGEPGFGGFDGGEGGFDGGVGGSTGGVSTGGRGGFPGKGGSPGTGGGVTGGTAGTGSGGGEGVTVEAQLLSDAVQFFNIFGFGESFVSYRFHIGEEELDFEHGRLIIGIEVEEGDDQCEVPEGVLDPNRVLMETNVDALNRLSVIDIMNALVTNGGMTGDPVRLYQEILDSYASAENALLPDAIHCGDELTDGIPTLNGYPITCDRIEHRNHAEAPFGLFQTAFVNRLDLAPENGAHCGQQRMIFADPSFGRFFMIVEAQIPNPRPEEGILGCAPLAQFWAVQNDIDDPAERGSRLAEAFLFGHPELLEAGFGPFYTAANLTVGSGQIRTNQFDDFPWMLREFKLALDGENVTAIPFPVAESPNGDLWDENIDLPQGEDCRDSFVSAAIEGLLTDDPNRMSFVVDHACKDAESRNDGSQGYPFRMTEGLRARLDEAGAPFGLSGDNLATRAQFAGSCIGCHSEAIGRDLGRGVISPFSNDFTHVSESTTECEGFDEGGICFSPSSGVRNVFFPSRMQVMGAVLGIPIIDNPCDGNGGSGGVGGTGGTGSMGVGGFGAGPGSGGSFGGSGMAGTGGTIIVDSPPAPEVDITLPSAAEPIEELQEQDEEIREEYGEKTLSGKSAQSTH